MPIVNITLKYFCSYLLVLGAKQCVKKAIYRGVLWRFRRSLQIGKLRQKIFHFK